MLKIVKRKYGLFIDEIFSVCVCVCLINMSKVCYILLVYENFYYFIRFFYYKYFYEYIIIIFI